MTAPLVVANWKALVPPAGARAYVARLGERLAAAPREVRAVIMPPVSLLAELATFAKEAAPMLAWGGQDCCADGEGAYTGEMPARLLREAGATWVLVGHSERRRRLGETDATTRAKAQAALAAGLGVLACLDAEEEGLAAQAATLASQPLRLASKPLRLASTPLRLAWEPPWAIGSGATPTPESLAHAMALLAQEEGSIYGGSVSPKNAATLARTPGVGGLLVGSAGLDADTFADIIAEASMAWTCTAA